MSLKKNFSPHSEEPHFGIRRVIVEILCIIILLLMLFFSIF